VPEGHGNPADSPVDVQEKPIKQLKPSDIPVDGQYVPGEQGVKLDKHWLGQ
jgi:hypothetical protein